MDASASRETAPSREARRRSSRRDVPDSTRGRPRPPLPLWSLDSRPRRPRPRICTRPVSVAGDGGSGGPPWRLHPGRAVTAARSSRSSKPTATTASDRRDRRDRRDRQRPGMRRRTPARIVRGVGPLSPSEEVSEGDPSSLSQDFQRGKVGHGHEEIQVVVCTRLLAQQGVDTPAAHDPTANLRSGQALRDLDRLGRRQFLLGHVTSLPDSDVGCRPSFGHDRPDGGIGRATSAPTAAFWVLDGRGELAEAVKDVTAERSACAGRRRAEHPWAGWSL